MITKDLRDKWSAFITETFFDKSKDDKELAKELAARRQELDKELAAQKSIHGTKQTLILKQLYEKQQVLLDKIQEHEREQQQNHVLHENTFLQANITQLKAKLFSIEREIAHHSPIHIASLIHKIVDLEHILEVKQKTSELILIQAQTGIPKHHLQAYIDYAKKENSAIVLQSHSMDKQQTIMSPHMILEHEFPYNLKLSKLKNLSCPTKRQENIEILQQQIEHVIKQHEKLFKGIFGVNRQQQFPIVSQATLDKANQALLLVAENLTCPQGRVIYFAQDQYNNLLMIDDKPIFFVKEREKLLAYQEITHDYDTVWHLPAGYSEEATQVIKYCHYSFDKKGDIIETRHAMQTDYQTLTFAKGKMCPLLEDGQKLLLEDEKFLFLEQEYLTLIKTNPLDQRLDVIEKTVLDMLKEYEITRHQQHDVNDICGHSLQYNIVRQALAQQDPLFWLKTEIDDLCQPDPSHHHHVLAQYYNQLPLINGELCIAILPNGHVKLLSSEKKICNLIQRLREMGYALPVNPRWGWQINWQHQSLNIPSYAFNWTELETVMLAYKEQIHNLQHELDNSRSSTDNDELKDNIKDTKAMLSAQKVMIQLKYDIEKLELYAPLTYHQTDAFSPLLHKIIQGLQDIETDIRQDALRRKKMRLQRLLDDYDAQFDSMAPIREQEMELAHDLAHAQSVIAHYQEF